MQRVDPCLGLTPAPRSARVRVQAMRGRVGRRNGHARQSTPASARADERVSDPQLDKRLPGHTDAFRLAIDCTQQIHRKVDVHALDFATRTRSVCQIQMRTEVLPRVVHLIEARCAEGLGLRGTALLRLRARGELR